MKIHGLKPVAPPRSVCLYFRREYFKTKFSNKKKSTWDATVMWSKLSSDERDKFRIRFEESKCQHEQEYALYLGKLEPYLQKKERNNSQGVQVNPADEVLNSEDAQHKSAGCEHTTHLIPEDAEHLDTTLTEQIRMGEESIVQEIVERPTPPPIDSRDLFMMTHEDMMDENQRQDVWRLLPKAQKLHYRTATNLLKKDFLEKYKMYLMSLSPFQLAQHLREKNLSFSK